MKITVAMRRLLLAMLFCTASVVAGAQDRAWSLSAYLVDSFVEVALKSAYSTRRHPVRKWTVPVSYFIVHQVGDEDLHRGLIHAHFQHLAEITGLAIQPADREAAANFLVVLTSEDRLQVDMLRFYSTDSMLQHEALMRHSVCLVTFATERRGSIARAVAMIPVDRARGRGDLVSCMVEELTHALGLPNDSTKNIPSIFSRQSGHAFLSGLDYLMLKMLYDPRVKAGMSEKAVLPILQTIAGEYERDKLFEIAERIAAASGLSRLSP
jgi:hypothetical protein